MLDKYKYIWIDVVISVGTEDIMYFNSIKIMLTGLSCLISVAHS